MNKEMQKEVLGDAILILIVFVSATIASNTKNNWWYLPVFIASLTFCIKSHLWLKKERRDFEDWRQNLRMHFPLEEDVSEKSNDSRHE